MNSRIGFNKNKDRYIFIFSNNNIFEYLDYLLFVTALGLTEKVTTPPMTSNIILFYKDQHILPLPLSFVEHSPCRFQFCP